MESSSSDDPWSYLNRQRKVRIDDREIVGFLSKAGKGPAGGGEFAVVVGSDESLGRANRQYRGKSGSTDVLSFPDGEDGRLGDILISALRAERQAGERGHRVEEELKILILHGLLHLLGHDHEDDDRAMRRAEARWRKKLGLRESLIERAGT